MESFCVFPKLFSALESHAAQTPQNLLNLSTNAKEDTGMAGSCNGTTFASVRT
jgi:hypothetical protein